MQPKTVIALLTVHIHPGHSCRNECQSTPDFQSVYNYLAFGFLSRAFFFLVDGQVVVSAEDNNGPKQMLWQAAWGMAGAYSHFCYSDVTLPAWFRIGLQQHCADVLVPGVYDNPADQRLAVAEIKSGTLNGLLDADNIIGDRQLVCKFIAAHVYKLNPIGFGQMLSMLKLGKTTDEALKSVFDMDQATFVRSFGKSVGLPQLTP